MITGVTAILYIEKRLARFIQDEKGWRLKKVLVDYGVDMKIFIASTLSPISYLHPIIPSIPGIPPGGIL